MEEKIYERQVMKQSLSQRVIDEHQIERHFTAADLKELYVFKPDRIDDPNQPKRPIPKLPKVSFMFIYVKQINVLNSICLLSLVRLISSD